MPREHSYFFTQKVSITGSARGTFTWSVGPGETFRAEELWWASTGAFSIEDIWDSDGNHYMNASTDEPILSTMLQKPQTAGSGVGKFRMPIEIGGRREFYMKLLDTSGSTNAVTLTLVGVKKYE